MKTRLKKTKNSTFKGKEVKNGSDYRESLLIAATWFLQNHSFNFPTNIIATLFWLLLPFLNKKFATGRIGNTEKEEVKLNFIKVVKNPFSNHHFSNIIANAIIQMQAKIYPMKYFEMRGKNQHLTQQANP